MKSKLDYFNEWKHVLPNFTEEQLRKMFFMMRDYANDYHKCEVKKLNIYDVRCILIDFGIWLDKNDIIIENGNITKNVDKFIKLINCTN
jgi:hypothetical protein